MSYTNPIIFVHGIQGSWLKNQYPVDYQNEIYWTGILKKKFESLHLNSINQTVDQDIDKFIFPHQAVPLAYESIVEELREEVTEHTYVFTYDWRKDNRLSAEKLKEFIELVLIKAQTHAKQNNTVCPQKVSLVGHSMGGLVIKWYVSQILKSLAITKIDKIITIATPYFGSLKSIEALIPGARNFFGLEAKKAMRKASRTLPGVYQLIPSWPNAVIEKGTNNNIDIFNQNNWQKNLVNKLATEYGTKFFQDMLDNAKDFTQIINKDYPANIRRSFFCIYGTGSETLKQVKVDTERRNMFEFEKAVEDKTGDGTVHKTSSYVKASGYFKDKRKLIEIGGQHVQMLNHGDVQDYIVSIFTKSKLLRSFESKS